MSNLHEPVMAHESIDALAIVAGQWYVDATFGRGGHTSAILSKGARVLGIDCDAEAISYGTRHFVQAIESSRLLLVRENFDHLQLILQDHLPDTQPFGVFADFGVSSPQLDTKDRGFSFQEDAPLDMRLDDRLGVKARDLVNALGKKELATMLFEVAQERHARTIAEAILRARTRKPIETTKDLASIIERVVHRDGHLHPATKTFMALRIIVNDELGTIQRFLPQAITSLASRGRVVTIAFHEGEDRLVKRAFDEAHQQGLGTVLTKKPITPAEEELQQNPRSRSSKLRIFEKA